MQYKLPPFEGDKTGQTDIEFQDSFIYRAILTNDSASSNKDVIVYYNQRGTTNRNIVLYQIINQNFELFIIVPLRKDCLDLQDFTLITPFVL